MRGRKKRPLRIRDPKARHLWIVQNAIRAFAKRNYQTTRTADLAKELQVSEAAIYKDFKSKKDLFLAVLDHIAEDMRSAAAPPKDAAPSAMDALTSMALGYLDYLSKNLDEARVLYQAVSDVHDPVIRKRLRRIFARHTEDLERVLRQGQKEGFFRPDFDTGEAAWAFLGAEQAFVFSRLLGFKYLKTRESVLELLAFIFRGLQPEAPGNRSK